MSSARTSGKTRQIIFYLSIVELKLRYRGTVLGFFWSVLEPLAQLLILYVVFTAIRFREEDFIIYLFSGLIMIHFFSRSTTQGLNSLIRNKPIIISLKLSKKIFPISLILTNLYMLAIEFVIFFIFIIIFDVTISYTILILPLIIGLLIIFTIGIGLLLSIVRLFFKDIQSIWGIVTLSLIFITPVFWKVENMQEEIARILLLNPLALLMEMVHMVVLYNTMPTLVEFGYVIISSLVILFLGWGLFAKLEKKTVDKL